MAGSFQVTPKTLHTKADSLRNQNKSLRDKIQDLRTQANGLDQLWEGDAHNAFKTQFVKDMTKMDEFCALIDSYANTLDNIAIKYENAESNSTTIASSKSY